MTSYVNYVVYHFGEKTVVRKESDNCTLKDLLEEDDLELAVSGECEFLLDTNEPLSIDDIVPSGKDIRCVALALKR